MEIIRARLEYQIAALLELEKEAELDKSKVETRLAMYQEKIELLKRRLEKTEE